jgi:hypothetical protein
MHFLQDSLNLASLDTMSNFNTGVVAGALAAGLLVK